MYNLFLIYNYYQLLKTIIDNIIDKTIFGIFVSESPKCLSLKSLSLILEFFMCARIIYIYIYIYIYI